MSANQSQRRRKKQPQRQPERAYHEGIGRLTHTQFEGDRAAHGQQPWGVAVALLIGGAVLMLAAIGARPLLSAFLTQPETVGELPAPRHVSLPAMVGSATAMAPPAPAEDVSPLRERAPAQTLPPALADPAPFVFDSPSLKPRGTRQVAEEPAITAPDANTGDGFTPRRKPRGLSNTERLNLANQEPDRLDRIDPGDPLSIHPINLQPTASYSLERQPVSFFATADMGTAGPSDLDDPNTDIRAFAPTQRLSDRALLETFDGDLSAAAHTRTVTLRRGETIADRLARLGVGRRDQAQIISALGKHVRLRALPAGYRFEVTTQAANQTPFQEAQGASTPAPVLIALDTRTTDGKKLSLTRQKDGAFTAKIAPIKRTRRLRASSGEIRGNLYLSMKAEGAPDSVINALANFFAYDVDFQRDIFAGDRFEAIYEVVYDDDGKVVDGGKIFYGRLSWRGQRREKGYYFFDPETATQRADYFDTDGKSARRLLMKTPIDGARLSSGFGARKHPILGYRKTHKGVDFAARRGTPIKATGDGIVERANRFGSYGNYIRIKHANRYKTAYAHLKGFARGIRKGKRVRQGDIIGYVGTTGRSTGPHLHYEVHHRGKAVNPQALKIATGTVLSGSARRRFKDHRDKIDRLRSPGFEMAPMLTQTIALPSGTRGGRR
ncbi:MAG: M23 family metallopeptidase [Pseudomonadota bacterium]